MIKPLGRQLVSDGAAEYYDGMTPEIAGASREQDPWPRVPPQPAFFLVYAPDRWDVLEGKLVPMLYRLSLNPGANAVTRGQGGRPDATDAIAQVERNGHFPLQWTVDGSSYLRAFQVGLVQDRRTGAPVKVMSWHTKFEQLYAGSEYIQSDTVGYVAWLESLIARRLLPQARPYVVERLVRFYEQKLHKSMNRLGGSSEVVVEYKRRLGIVLGEQARRSVDSRGAPAVPDTDAEPELDVRDPAIADDPSPSSPRRRT
jgi:hypothetical protein